MDSVGFRVIILSRYSWVKRFSATLYRNNLRSLTSRTEVLSGKQMSLCSTCSGIIFKMFRYSTLLKLYPNIYSASRRLSTTLQLMKRLEPQEVKKRVENLTDCFTEARELLGDARESLGSVYFSEDMADAQRSVSATVAAYEALLADLEEDQRNDVIRTIGLKMGELKAQEQAIKDLLDE